MLGWTGFILLGLLALSVPVAAALGVLGLFLEWKYSIMPLHLALGEIVWQNAIEYVLVAIPLFIMLGEILLRAGIAERMYTAMVQWLSWLPGGTMHSNIGSCAIFAASSGSSVATAATVGTVAYPEVARRGYNEPLFLGTLAAGGTLGILIPPSINLIIYGLLTDTSVPQLYLAGFIPGVVLASLFMLTVLIAVLFKPEWGGSAVETSWDQRWASLPHLLPPLGIFVVVVGSIYAGFATPTEAASVGVCAALILAACFKSLNWTMLREAIEGTLRTTAMVMLIIFAALFLNFVLAAVGMTGKLLALIEGLGVTPMQTLWVVIAFYIIVGCFMETLSMLITTTPLIAPILIGMGFDPVWLGILITILLETALITPPVGVNLYIVHGVRDHGTMNDVIIGASPFVITMFVMIGILVLFPDIALFLPELFYR
ncbi:MAG: TRAP transporter large permease [Pseudomonadota bacterium]|jgi:tripartite ATP-independent transporter DctM subunit|nr:TRAP transporter large permease [Pseudomonadota bacterium]